jgi:hypothetical protein
MGKKYIISLDLNFFLHSGYSDSSILSASKEVFFRVGKASKQKVIVWTELFLLILTMWGQFKVLTLVVTAEFCIFSEIILVVRLYDRHTHLHTYTHTHTRTADSAWSAVSAVQRMHDGVSSLGGRCGVYFHASRSCDCWMCPGVGGEPRFLDE